MHSSAIEKRLDKRRLLTSNGYSIKKFCFSSEGVLWHSSAIEKRLDKRRLLTSNGSLCRLKGHMDKLQAKEDSKLGFLSLYISQWLSGRVPDSRPKGPGFEPHRRHCVVSLSKNINPSLVLVQLRKTHSRLTERLLMDIKNQIKQIYISQVNEKVQLYRPPDKSV